MALTVILRNPSLQSKQYAIPSHPALSVKWKSKDPTLKKELKFLSFFINKHDWYDGREVVDILSDKLKIKDEKKN